jgi:hypothetical protein
VGIASGHAGGGGHRPPATVPACCSWRRMHQGKPAGGHWVIWVIWVIWVTVLNCMAMHAIGSFGSLFLHSPNDLKGWRQRARSFKALGHLGQIVTSQKLVRDAAWASPNSLLRVYPYIKIFYFLN